MDIYLYGNTEIHHDSYSNSLRLTVQDNEIYSTINREDYFLYIGIDNVIQPLISINSNNKEEIIRSLIRHIGLANFNEVSSKVTEELIRQEVTTNLK